MVSLPSRDPAAKHEPQVSSSSPYLREVDHPDSAEHKADLPISLANSFSNP